MKQALIYVRVSTDEQAKEGQSIETQIKLCQRHADGNGITVVETYRDEGKSGSTMNRPGLQALLDRVGSDKTIDYVLVLDTDRLARNTLDHLTIKAFLSKKGVQLISISQLMLNDSPEGNFIDVVLAGANAFQSQITGRKTSKVLAEKAKMGWWIGWAPIGYMNIDNPHPTSTLDKRIIAPHPTIGPLITQLFELYKTGTYTLESLTKKMKPLGLVSPRTNNLQMSSVNAILNNPIYYGDMRIKGEVILGNHEPLIDKPTWMICQNIMANHNQHASRTRKHDYLLRGFIFCGDCGSRYWAAPAKGHTTIKEYYYCKHCKRGTYVDVKDLEADVEKWVGTIQITDEYAKELMEIVKVALQNSRSSRDTDMLTLANQKKAIEAKLQVAEDKSLDGTYTKDQFQRITARLEADLSALDTEIGKAQYSYKQSLGNIQNLVNMARNLKQTYHDADNNLKRYYLDLFFEKLIVKNKSVEKALPSVSLAPFLKNGQVRVRVRTNWLPR